jgi:hypothetical protein
MERNRPHVLDISWSRQPSFPSGKWGERIEAVNPACAFSSAMS